jgi:glycosyltransferase auxiliary protein
MSTTATDSELGRHLLTLRGFHFIFGAQGDPYALILRAEGDDPRELGEQVRSRGALYQSEAGAWVTASHDLAAQVLADPRFALRHVDVDGAQQQHVFQDVWSDPKMCHVLPLDAACLNLERDDYERLRGVGEPVLGAAALDAARAEVERVFRQTLDQADGDFDLWADFAHKAAVEVVARLVGVPEDKHERFVAACSGVGTALDAGLCPPQLPTARALMASVDRLRSLFEELIEARRDAPGDDPVSAMLRAVGGGASAATDVLAVCMLVTVAGIEVAANLVCNAAAALIDHPDQWAKLRSEPDLAAGAVRETLRFDPPIRLHNRIAREDVELGGQEVKADSQVVVLVEAANRDPEVYPDPARFDITRSTEAADLTLGDGAYASLVGPLATLQATLALRALASGVPALRQRDGVLRRMRSPVVRGVLRFPVATA